MKKFISHTGIIAPLDISNVDTDAIIPKQFLQKIDKTGFSDSLFYNWKFIDGNYKKPNKEFVLNQPEYIHSTILITRNNFGCGSSREHAVWALLDYGFKCIIAPDFADIFYNNSVNNNLLLITFPDNIINNIFNLIYDNIGIHGTVNLKNKYFLIKDSKYSFEIDDFYRSCLLSGFDSIDFTLQHIRNIEKYETYIPKYFLRNKII